MEEASQRSRPDRPTTEVELERSIRVLRIAVGGAIAAVVVITVLLITALDAPTVPLVPIAALVVVVDVVMLNSFVRQRRRALEELRRHEARAP